MKIAEVVIGQTYLTKVGETLVRVMVVDKVHGYGSPYSDRRTQDKFRVRREGEARVLPKARTAAALRPLPSEPAKGDGGLLGPAADEYYGARGLPSGKGGT